MEATHPAALIRRFLEAYGRGDLGTVRAGLADGVIAYVTTADGDADRVEGRERYMARLPDLRAAGGALTVTQVLEVDTQHVMAMVEIRAARGASRLHNHAAFLARVERSLVTRLWMVEAQPAHSDEFWS